MPDEVVPLEIVLHKSEYRDSLQIWGKLYLNRSNKTVAGWLVDSWSLGAPYWSPKMHWITRKDDKPYDVQLNIGRFGSVMEMHGEDKDIEPERARFIREHIEKWEKEWLESEAKKS